MHHRDYDVFKLDADGAEFQILKSDARWIRETRPLAWLECNEAPESLRLLESCLWAGLRLIYFAHTGCRSNAYRNGGAPLFPVAYHAALLLGNGAERDMIPSSSDLVVRAVRSARDRCNAL